MKKGQSPPIVSMFGVQHLKHKDLDKGRKFTGQPVLSQLLSAIPARLIRDAALKHNSNRYYKKLPLRVHMVRLLYGVFSYCNGLRELCEGLLACEGKLSHLGFDSVPARSTLSDANSRRSYLVFETIYQGLLGKYHGFISDSRLKGLSIRNLKIIDSSTISLFGDILRGVGRPRLDGARRKGGIKVHAMMDAFSGVTEFVRMTPAKVHDRQFLLKLKLPAESFLVFDKAYNDYRQFHAWTRQQVWFVSRMKENPVYHVCKVLIDRIKRRKTWGVLKDQLVTVGYKQDNTNIRLCLRRVTYKAEDGRVHIFITNNLKISASQVARIYKCRWMIELLFKQIKQNFPLRYFWGDSQNAIQTKFTVC